MKYLSFGAVGVLCALLLAACSHPAMAQSRGARASHAAARSVSKAIVPSFSLTEAELEAMVRSMPKSVRERILARPAAFLRAMSAILRKPSTYFVLVDKRHALPGTYVPPQLVNLAAAGLSVSRKDLVLRRSIMDEVDAMVHHAREDHVVLLFSSTYRSYSYQRYVYDREVKLYGKRVADRESAVPGTSQHQLGDTIDFGCICNAFAKTKAFRWLTAHAASYGFSMTYPEGMESVTGYRYEPWHWHYITTAGTKAQAEFFDSVQQYLLEFLYANRKKLVGSYRGGDLGSGWGRSEIVHRIPEAP